MSRRLCPFCDTPIARAMMCAACQRSYDRQVKRDDGTIWAILTWAARRARRFERSRLPPREGALPYPNKAVAHSLKRVLEHCRKAHCETCTGVLQMLIKDFQAASLRPAPCPARGPAPERCYKCREPLTGGYTQTAHHGKWCPSCAAKEPGVRDPDSVDRRSSWE